MNKLIDIGAGKERNYENDLLLFIAGMHHCWYGIFDRQKKELCVYRYYSSDSGDLDYESLFDSDELIKGSHSKAFLVFDINESVIVPSEFCNGNNQEIFAEALYGKTGHAELRTEYLPDQDAQNTYRIPVDFLRWISRFFTGAEKMHLYTCLLKANSSHEDEIRLDFKNDSFVAIVYKKGKLQLIQSYWYRQPEDVLYMLLKIVQQTGLSQRETPVLLSGLIEQDSALYRELYKYFIRLEFEGLHDGFQLSESFHDYPGHYFSIITRLASCAS